ncbi:hypothetical protein VRRI112168_03725 [Vreelandella rituensis]|uniref:MvaT DNA-binding domain-containing protein n=1 Tax=Vreelandella rituensis TaxID=2282306 RepID=A0A368U9H6_9GAMM|nr:hypothetical protein [Halomonas rituensis]RCV93760.1 hypothetical protein DU506_00985 [Halomonas rituensis]
MLLIEYLTKKRELEALEQEIESLKDTAEVRADLELVDRLNALMAEYAIGFNELQYMLETPGVMAIGFATAEPMPQEVDSLEAAPASALEPEPPKPKPKPKRQEKQSQEKQSQEKQSQEKQKQHKQDAPASAPGSIYRKRPLRVFRNPHTGEVIRTRGGKHRQLTEWSARYGPDVVAEWQEE